MSDLPAVLLVAHGSRSTEGAAEMLDFADRFAARFPEMRCEAGFLELAAPPISDAVTRLAEAGEREIIVLPLMLLGAGHAKDDIPAALTRERIRHPDLHFTYGRQLDLHATVLEVFADRIAAAAGAGRADTTAVLAVGRGSSDPDANGDLHKVCRLVWEGRPYGWVEAAFSGVTAPRVPDGLERCRRLGAERIVVAPYYLFDGILIRRMADDASAFAATHPDVDVVMAAYMGLDDRLLDVVRDRYDEAVRGDARMNCDLCVHRVALPGFEDEVGRAAVPHDHPDDPTHTHSHAYSRARDRSRR